MASDGSLHCSNDATKGWKLLCRQDNTSACGHGVVQTSGGNGMSSLRAEIGGFLGGLVAVDTLLSTHHPIKNYHNPQCLHSGSSKTLAPDYDLLQAAMQIAKKHNITVIPHNVKSHQDLKIAYEKLSWESKLNCDVESLANQARTCTRCKSAATKKYILPPGHRATLFFQGQWIMGHVSMAIREVSY